MQTRPKAFGWLAAGLTIAVLILSVFSDGGGILVLRKVGAVILVASALFIYLPFYALRKYGRSKAEEDCMQTTAVVDRGIYAVVRHPQYLGYIMINMGFVCLVQSALVIALAIPAVVLFVVHTVLEDRYCAEKHGEEWRDYARRVPLINVFAGLWRLMARRWRGVQS
ncbi:MAG: isoprenylcysteine carboxylmethyltransferase family protein [Candidatus Coatesbacteria bacterium]|nr:isoprenylcysteine carboxylmethyltransferase family protein [Candidatus Coatesbacteria bacterium]